MPRCVSANHRRAAGPGQRTCNQCQDLRRHRQMDLQRLITSPPDTGPGQDRGSSFGRRHRLTASSAHRRPPCYARGITVAAVTAATTVTPGDACRTRAAILATRRRLGTQARSLQRQTGAAECQPERLVQTNKRRQRRLFADWIEWWAVMDSNHRPKD
ncbi:hypothetical protein EIQ04_07170 [Xanthomonas campestris pv. raphani]|nr:hypothetical protein D0A40_00730 [Xanthomonas campestris pv. raphani]